MADKQRLDYLIINRGLIKSREKAKAVIMSGQVFVDQQKVDKPGAKVDMNSNIEIKESLKYVSRGGFKLEKALKVFNIDLDRKICMDVGCSTGGFTDCMLQNGAQKVYPVDVGYGQLAWELRQDDRVIPMERTNIRYVKQSDIEELIDFVSIDVSFISLSKVFPVIKELLNDNGEIICLVKPQFEAGKEKVGKKGVVRDPEVHKEVLMNLIEFVYNNNLFVADINYSPIKGPKGNIEYLAYITKKEAEVNTEKIIYNVIESSHNMLNNF